MPSEHLIKALELILSLEGSLGSIVIDDHKLTYDYWIDGFEDATLEVKLYQMKPGKEDELITSRMGYKDEVLIDFRCLFNREIRRR